MNYVNVNGITLAYERRGRGAPLVLLHGFPLDHTIWDEVAPLLEGRADVILPDLRGHGASEAPESSYSIDDMADDVTALLDHLGVERATVVGHSMGGYVALAFAQRHLDRLAGLGLVATHAAADSPERRAAREAQMKEVAEKGVAPLAEGMSAKLTRDPALAARLRNLILKTKPAGVIGALRAMAGRPDRREFLPSVDVPAVVVIGLDDAILPPELGREMASLLPQARLFEIAGVGHMPMMEAPRQVAEALLELRED
ncbi:MAG: alpha/beta fold hydrolase [Anaerolineae bacterium]|nr:MAG: alpha/beta fold hydrolase [Anaerolineae bacterium]